tara:strand:+ start:1495 stop:2883 length:1389 start_codon:yes stop_codon:yes gene_type:complete
MLNIDNLSEGKKLIKQKKFSKALEVLINFKHQKNFDYKVFFYLGLTYFELNNFNESIKYYEKFLKKEPHSISTLINLAIVKQTKGDINSAKQIYQKIIKINKTNLRAYYGLFLLDEKNFSEEIFSILLDIEKNHELSLYDKGILNFLLSKREKKRENLKNEINYLDKFHLNIFDSNKYYNKSSQFYYNKIASHYFDKVKINHNKKNLIKNEYISPVFIIGLPRSGSTLVESILTSGFQKISSFGECHVINVSILEQIGPKIYKDDFNLNKFNFELDLEKMNENVINKYSQFFKNSNKKNQLFVDKSLENFFNIEVIVNLFPKAKFLHTFRNILDSIISIYQSMLADLSWAHNIDDILEYINNYLNIIEYFKKKYPNLILDVNLEDLSKDTEKITKEIFQFCDLTWDAQILNFYRRKDLFSKTLSFNQIRSKVEIYNINKYKPYYSLLESYKDNYKWLNIKNI